MAWEQLTSIIQENRELIEAANKAQPTACPVDGTPLDQTPEGLHCPFDGWQPD